MHNDGMLTATDVLQMRKRLNESQATFGERFGVDQSTAHRWETDGPPRRGPAKLALEKLRADMAAESQAAQ